ncbi:MAG: hypothetical protein PHW46_01425 [Candidatus Omnitrophica bacterium]|nr:hypothetical protein [Candidatus Omnitrophota bacterium]
MAKNTDTLSAKLVNVFVAFTFFAMLLPCDICKAIDTPPVTGSSAVTAQVATGETIAPVLPKAGNVTVNFKDVDIKTVLNYLSEVSGVDIVPAPGVDGNVTMRLRDKPWEVALDIVTRNYGFAYSRDDEQGIIRVMPKGQLHMESPITEVISLNNLVREIELSKKTGEQQNSDEIVVQQKEESIKQLMDAISSVLDANKGEKATFIASVNSVIVTAIPAKITEIRAMITKVDRRTPQIVLDTKVIEVVLGDDEKFGIDWNTVFSMAGARRPITFPFTNDGTFKWIPGADQRQFFPQSDTVGGGSNFPLIGTAANLVNPTSFTSATNTANLFSYGTLDFSTFTATLRLLHNRGNTEVLSCPRITTLDNQKATIKVVDKIMLQKTQETTQTAGIVSVTFENEEDAREVGVKLTVIPHVNSEGDISVNLLPEVSTPATGTTNGFQTVAAGPSGGISTVALMFSSREANTIVRARDGETVFLGGLIKKTVTKTDNRVPIIGDILGKVPVMGNLFKYEAEKVDRTEIVFFVTLNLVREAKDSVDKSDTIDMYNRYIVNGEAKSTVAKDYKGSKKGIEAYEKENVYGKKTDKDTNVVKHGEWQTKEEKVEVPVLTANTDSVVDDKKSKPLFDFRKNKKEGQ